MAAPVDKRFIADLVARTRFSEELLAKDYYLTRILFLLKDIDGLNFKGGTALQKIFLDYARLSEDLDFTVTSDVRAKATEITTLLEREEFVSQISSDKSVHQFIRLVVQYQSFSGRDDTIFIDLNERANLLTPPEEHPIAHFYPDIPSFTVRTLSQREMVAEKVAAAIGRNKPRDHYDIYRLIKKHVPIEMHLVRRKCAQSGDEFSVLRMFNRAKKLKNRWDADMKPLLRDDVGFEEVMQTLAKEFKLKAAKEATRTTDAKEK